jgi:hypothetical protein
MHDHAAIRRETGTASKEKAIRNKEIENKLKVLL